MSMRPTVAIAAGNKGALGVWLRRLCSLMLVVGFGMPARAHVCGPPFIPLAEGETVDWVIDADLEEKFTFYEVIDAGDPAIAIIEPGLPFEAHDGEYTITGVSEGQTFMLVR